MTKIARFLEICLVFVLIAGQSTDCLLSKKNHHRRFFGSTLKPLPATKLDEHQLKFTTTCNQTSFFTSYIDHFNFGQDSNNNNNNNNNINKNNNNATSNTYQMRYIVQDKYWNANTSPNRPIFFYTGNEGDIVWFCQNLGFMWEAAEDFGALVVFAEHRYYGESLPFGPTDSFKQPGISYLTSEQALADYAYFIDHLQEKYAPKTKDVPVITFGGSYGGMLSAWFRIKYPNVVTGAIAASAPVFQFNVPCDTFQSVVSRTFQKADTQCPNIIRRSWSAIDQMAQSESDLARLSLTFRTCKPIRNSDDKDVLKAWLADIYGNVAMSDYPYPTTFLAPLPGYPVKAICDKIVQQNTSKVQEDDPYSIVNAVAQGVNVWTNFTGQVPCNDLSSDTPSDINMDSWTYQTCTEFVFPMCTDGVNDMFEPESWNYDEYVKECQQQFQVTPKPEWAGMYYGKEASDYKSYSNIFFSNGDLDPWSAGGVLEKINSKLPAELIEGGAHHLDLRFSNPMDPKSVLRVRKLERLAILGWIIDHNNNNNKNNNNSNNKKAKL